MYWSCANTIDDPAADSDEIECNEDCDGNDDCDGDGNDDDNVLIFSKR
jgi:hypothetical protein